MGSSIHKNLTRLPGLARDKHSNLLQTFVNYRREKSYHIDPCLSVTCFVFCSANLCIVNTVEQSVVLLSVIVLNVVAPIYAVKNFKSKLSKRQRQWFN